MPAKTVTLATITATQPGHAHYLPAAPVERELLVVDQAGQRVRDATMKQPSVLQGEL